MTITDFWVTYAMASHLHHSHTPTVQLIELDEKFTDIEDILDHVFRQGYVESECRPFAHWEGKDGVLVKPSCTVLELLERGLGKTPETALKLVVEDVPTCVWFSYVYLHGHASHPGTAQRIKLTEHKFESLAHLTNYIFSQGFVAPKFRPAVHWAQSCGKRVAENVCINILLLEGQGTEDKPLRLVIDEIPSCHCHSGHGHSGHLEPCHCGHEHSGHSKHWHSGHSGCHRCS